MGSEIKGVFGVTEEFKTYYGTKRIDARPEQGGPTGIMPGYTVRYPDGYLSWSPETVFEAAYQEVDALSFGHAIVAMKEGRRVARAGWAGQWIALEDGKGGPHIRTYTIEGPVPYGRGWVASHPDILANDWQILEGL